MSSFWVFNRHSQKFVNFIRYSDFLLITVMQLFSYINDTILFEIVRKEKKMHFILNYADLFCSCG